MRVWLLSNADVPLTKSISSILLDRVVALFGMVLIVAIGFPWLMGILRESALQLAAITAMVAGFAGIALLLSLDKAPLPQAMRARLLVQKLLTLAVDGRAIFLAPRILAAALSVSGTDSPAGEHRRMDSCVGDRRGRRPRSADSALAGGAAAFAAADIHRRMGCARGCDDCLSGAGRRGCYVGFRDIGPVWNGLRYCGFTRRAGLAPRGRSLPHTQFVLPLTRVEESRLEVRTAAPDDEIRTTEGVVIDSRHINGEECRRGPDIQRNQRKQRGVHPRLR